MSKMTWVTGRRSRARALTRPARVGVAAFDRPSHPRPARHGVLPVGEERAQGGDERQRLVENEMMIRLRDLDDRRVAVEEIVHVLAGLGWHEIAELGSQLGSPAERVIELVDNWDHRFADGEA